MFTPAIPPLRRFTLKVMGRWSVKTVDVRADASGLCSRAGTSLLALVAERVGLAGGLGDALAGTRERRGGHEPGRVFCDLAVMLADGGRCVSDLAALAGQPSLFGEVASVSTARRVLLSVGESELEGIRAARAAARARAWAAGAAPERVILDFDATPIDVHSEKEQAAGHYKGGFGFNPLLVSCGRELLAGILRPGNAGANNAEDHLGLLDLALEQLPESALYGDGDIVVRAESLQPRIAPRPPFPDVEVVADMMDAFPERARGAGDAAALDFDGRRRHLDDSGIEVHRRAVGQVIRRADAMHEAGWNEPARIAELLLGARRRAVDDERELGFQADRGMREAIGAPLAAFRFLRDAPKTQVDAFWRSVGRAMHDRVSSTPTWLSTAGMGVSWLHLRLDSRPKYYRHEPYKTNA